MLNSVDAGKRLPQFSRFLLDLAFVLLFVVIGLLSHREDLLRLPLALLPFVLALIAAHLGVFVVKSRRQLPLMLEGGMIWITTLMLGVGFRLSFGQSAAPSFIIVSALFLLVFLLGWRYILLALSRRR